MTGNSVTKRAMRALGRIGEGQTPSASDSQDALEVLNGMINTWAAQNLTMHFLLRTVVTLVSGTPSYTIGTGGVINIVRPLDILYATLIIDDTQDPVTEIPIDVLSDQRWAGIMQKDLTNPLVQSIWFDHAYVAGLGLIYVWPIPDVGTTQLVLYTQQAITQFVNLVSTYVAPPAYEDALVYQLARRLAPEYNMDAPATVIELAKETFGILKRANIRPVEIGVDTGLLARDRGGVWDWRTGTVR